MKILYKNLQVKTKQWHRIMTFLLYYNNSFSAPMVMIKCFSQCMRTTVCIPINYQSRLKTTILLKVHISIQMRSRKPTCHFFLRQKFLKQKSSACNNFLFLTNESRVHSIEDKRTGINALH